VKEIQRDLSNKAIINLVGPSAVGKTSLINEIDSNYPDFSRVISYTTRKPRDGEPLDAYRFITADDTDIDKLTTSSVQYDRFPGTDIVYGTQVSDYRNKYNLLDTLSSSVRTFRGLGFSACKQFIIVTSPMEWQERINTRAFSDEQLLNRLDEGIKSLEWSLSEKDAVKWIYNQTSHLQASSKSIVELSVDNSAYTFHDDRNAKEIGRDLLWYIKYLKRNRKKNYEK
jgi:guanylate kinase